MEGLYTQRLLPYAIKVFDLRKSRVAICQILETQITPEGLAMPWISEIGKLLQGTPFADAPISSEQVHWVATSAAREQGNNSLIRPTIKQLPPNTPLHMVLAMEHGLVILPCDEKDVLSYVFVIFEGRQLVAVAKKDVICKCVQEKVLPLLNTGKKETVRFTVHDKIVATDQNFETVAGGSGATYGVANAIVVREVTIKLDILERDHICTKTLTCVSTETMRAVRGRVETLMRENHLLNAGQDIVLLDPATYSIVPCTSIVQSILDTFRFGQTTAALLGGKGFAPILELKVIRKPPQAFPVTVAMGSREIPMFVNNNTCVFDVKQLVTQIVNGTSVGQLKMTMGTRELDDSATVNRIGLRSGRTLYLTMRDPITICLFRELPCGEKERHTVRVYRGDSIKELKVRASLLMDLPEGEIDFRMNEQWLEEEETLKAFDLQNQDEILVCHLPHKAVLRLHFPGKGRYNVFIADSRGVTVKLISDDAAQRFGLESSMLFVVQHPGNVILSESTSVKDIGQCSKLSVHPRPSIDPPECKDDRLQYRFIASADSSVDVKAQLVTVIQGKTFVYLDDCSGVSITSSNDTDDSQPANDKDQKPTELKHSTETSDDGAAVSEESREEINKNRVASQPTAGAQVMPLCDVRSPSLNLRDCSRSDSSCDITDDRNRISREFDDYEQTRSAYHVNMRDSRQAQQAAGFIDTRVNPESDLPNMQSPPYPDPRFAERFQEAPTAPIFQQLPMKHGDEFGNGGCCPPPSLAGQASAVVSEHAFDQARQDYFAEPIPPNVSGMGLHGELPLQSTPCLSEPGFDDDPGLDSVSQIASYPMGRPSFTSANYTTGSVVKPWFSGVRPSDIEKKRFRKAKRTAARMIGDRWADLARCLELEEGDIQKIRKEFDGNISDQCNNMLDVWTQQCPRAGIDGLQEALVELQRNDILDKIAVIYDNLDSCSDVSSLCSGHTANNPN